MEKQLKKVAKNLATEKTTKKDIKNFVVEMKQILGGQV